MWKHAFMPLYCNYQGTWKSGDAVWRILSNICTAIIKLRENQVNTYEDILSFCRWYDLTRFCLHLDGGGILDLFYLYCKIPDIIGWWRNFGTVSFVLQNIWLFWTAEEVWMYFNYTAKFPTFLDVREILDLFYLNCKIHDIFGWWRLKIVLF